MISSSNMISSSERNIYESLNNPIDCDTSTDGDTSVKSVKSVELTSDEKHVNSILDFTCFSCGGNLIVKDAHFICMKCCCDFGTFVDESPEWRNFGSESGTEHDGFRCSFTTNYLLQSSTYGTGVIGGRNDGIIGRMKRYMLWANMPYEERAMMEVFCDYNEKGLECGISKETVVEACMIYRTVYKGLRDENRIIRGKNKDGVKAFCLFEAMQKRNPIRMAVVAKMYGLSANKMRYGKRIMTRLINENKTENKTKINHETLIIPTLFDGF